MPHNGITLVWACNPPMPIKFGVKRPSATVPGYPRWSAGRPKETTPARRGAVAALALFPRSDEPQFIRSKLLVNGALSVRDGIRLCHRLTRLRPVLFKGHRPFPDVSPNALHDAVFNMPVFHFYRRANLEACSSKYRTLRKKSGRRRLPVGHFNSSPTPNQHLARRSAHGRIAEAV